MLWWLMHINIHRSLLLDPWIRHLQTVAIGSESFIIAWLFSGGHARARAIHPFAKRSIPNNSATTHYDSIKL